MMDNGTQITDMLPVAVEDAPATAYFPWAVPVKVGDYDPTKNYVSDVVGGLLARPTTIELAEPTGASGIGKTGGGTVQDYIDTLGSDAGSAEVGFLQSGADAVARSSQAKLRERVSPFDFGAVGDGTADDTAAFLAALAALASGGTLYLGNGYTFLLSGSLVLEKPINIAGGTKEPCILLFADDGTYEEIGGKKAAVIALHSSTTLTGYSGDARRTVLRNFTLQLAAGGPADMRGVSIHTPIYCQEVDAKDFTSDSFAVVAGSSSPVAGVANGCRFSNCTAQDNGGNGWFFDGDDANKCLLDNCGTFGNGGWGFRDESLLGNVYISPEADSNTSGAFHGSATATNRSRIVGDFFEIAQTVTLGNLNSRDGPLALTGVDTASGGSQLAPIPSGDVYSTQGFSFASTPDIANSGGDSPNAGVFARIAPGLIDLKPISDGLHVRIATVLSGNYVDFMNGSEALIRFPKTAIAGNLDATRPYLPNGFITGGSAQSGIVGAGSAAPTTGTYAVGAIWLNDAPAPSGNVGWVCTSAGTPGTWKSWGTIAS